MLCHSKKSLQIDTLWSLNWQTQSSVPDELCEGPKASTDTESDRVVEWLLESIMMEQDSRSGVNIGMRVFGLGIS
jgi:hypothetical protein